VRGPGGHDARCGFTDLDRNEQTAAFLKSSTQHTRKSKRCSPIAWSSRRHEGDMVAMFQSGAYRYGWRPP
jgi:hypothetical protein